jgi:hypothetical protein
VGKFAQQLHGAQRMALLSMKVQSAVILHQKRGTRAFRCHPFVDANPLPPNTGSANPGRFLSRFLFN